MVVIQAPPIVVRRAAARTALAPVPAARREKLGADPGAQLGGGLVGEGEGEDRVGGDALVDDEARVALDHHPGLAGACARLEQDIAPARLDRRLLLGRRRALDRRRGRRLGRRRRACLARRCT